MLNISSLSFAGTALSTREKQQPSAPSADLTLNPIKARQPLTSDTLTLSQPHFGASLSHEEKLNLRQVAQLGFDSHEDLIDYLNAEDGYGKNYTLYGLHRLPTQRETTEALVGEQDQKRGSYKSRTVLQSGPNRGQRVGFPFTDQDGNIGYTRTRTRQFIITKFPVDPHTDDSEGTVEKKRKEKKAALQRDINKTNEKREYDINRKRRDNMTDAQYLSALQSNAKHCQREIPSTIPSYLQARRERRRIDRQLEFESESVPSYSEEV